MGMFGFIIEQISTLMMNETLVSYMEVHHINICDIQWVEISVWTVENAIISINELKIMC